MPTLKGLTKDIETLEQAAFERGRESMRGDILHEVKVGWPKKATRRAPAKPKEPAKKKRKNPWATMTPKAKKARVRKMLAARGLKPKSER